MLLSFGSPGEKIVGVELLVLRAATIMFYGNTLPRVTENAYIFKDKGSFHTNRFVVRNIRVNSFNI